MPQTGGENGSGKQRQSAADRRTSILRALWRGSFARRRLGPRRGTDRHPAATDWFSPQWLATAILIMVLSSADALLTLALVSRGATEMNPFMEPMVSGSGHGFAYWKLGLTALGVVVLTMLARFRILGGIAVGNILYVVLCAYLVLVGYELWLLRKLAASGIH
ncbi:MAG TPA: DUF5658 family protein [Steroidobacteraceae bacterium]|nr:DUF5658 family protein [Steroidobacteraceae bacterium]